MKVEITTKEIVEIPAYELEFYDQYSAFRWIEDNYKKPYFSFKILKSDNFFLEKQLCKYAKHLKDKGFNESEFKQKIDKAIKIMKEVLSNEIY